MNAVRPLFIALAVALAGPVSAVFDQGQEARAVCTSLITRAARLGLDPAHKRLLSPLNRFMAQQRQAAQAHSATSQRAHLGYQLPSSEIRTLLWQKLTAELRKEMPELRAQYLAVELLDTPEGVWITGQRVLQAKLEASLAQSAGPSGRRSPIYTPARAVSESNYAALAAIERTFSFEGIFDSERYAEKPELQTQVSEVQIKLATDLEFFLDETVRNVVAEWERQIRAGQRKAGHRPSTFEDFFGNPPSDWDGSSEHAKVALLFHSLTLKYLQEAVERFYASPRVSSAPETVEPPRKGWRRFFR